MIEYVDFGQRVVVPGFRGQQLAWLGRDGMIEKTVLRADAFEMPRCERSRLLRLRLSTTPPIDLEELARFLGTIISMEPIRVVVWGDLTGDVGMAFAARDWVKVDEADWEAARRDAARMAVLFR